MLSWVFSSGTRPYSLMMGRSRMCTSNAMMEVLRRSTTFTGSEITFILALYTFDVTFNFNYNSVFFRYGQNWYVNDRIGSSGGKIRAPAGIGKFPPVKGWEYWDGKGWVEEPTLECGPPLPSCKAVNVELSGRYLF